MSFGRTKGVVVSGIDGVVIDVEIAIAQGLPRVVMSGLPDSAITQAPDRLRAAMVQSRWPFPDTRMTINLAPASLKKHGAGLDLAMAVGIALAQGTIRSARAERTMHIGELGMDGSVRPVPGILPAVLAARQMGIEHVVVPQTNAHEASLVGGMTVYPVRHLADVRGLYEALDASRDPELEWEASPIRDADKAVSDMRDIVGQAEARFALEVAASGGHHLSMVGPPGSGKTMLASRLPSILPALTEEESLLVTSINSVLGVLGDGVLVTAAPFVAPHHSATMPAMVGGGSGKPRPGAVSQAHGGVLFLDEAPEFRREVLDALRQPLEAGVVNIARADEHVQYPSRFQLVLASNPCPCGKFFGNGAGCTCSSQARRTYLKRLSGPLLDRIDVHLHVDQVRRSDLSGETPESSGVIAARVVAARAAAKERWRDLGLLLNAQVPGSALRASKWAPPRIVTAPLDRALDIGTLSLRGYDRTLRLAWTMCDMRGAVVPDNDDIHAALTLRSGGTNHEQH